MRRNYHTKLSGEIISRNYEQKLSAEITTRNCDLANYVAQKCVIYRDTGISKKKERSDNISIFHDKILQFISLYHQTYPKELS